MWVTVTSSKSCIALFSFQTGPCRGDKPVVDEEDSGGDSRRNPRYGAVAQLAGAPALQAGCRGFESHQLHQTACTVA